MRQLYDLFEVVSYAKIVSACMSSILDGIFLKLTNLGGDNDFLKNFLQFVVKA